VSQLLPHQQRVVAEKAELDEKLSKLKAFFETELYHNLDAAEHDLLACQSDIMEEYSAVLGARIAAFTPEVSHA
jgi:hypothetical protein